MEVLPEEKHKRYWESFPLPVLLVLHDPDSGKSYWTDARQALRTPGSENTSIEIPEAEAKLVEAGTLPAGDGRHVAQEGFFDMTAMSYFPRLPLIRAFQDAAWGRDQNPP